MTFKIKEARERRGLSQKELADMLQISNATLSGYETGAHDPRSDMLSRIADICGVTTDFLLGRSRPVNSPVLAADGSESIQSIAPNLDAAARAATRALIDYNVSSCPVDPLAILQAMPNVIVLTFTEMVSNSGPDGESMVTLFGASSQDAVTLSKNDHDGLSIVAYNQRLPFYMVQMALARELGHILLRHGEAMPESICSDEAMIFARYLLCPRPLIRALLDAGTPITVEALGNLTGCYGRMLAGIRETGGAHIPASDNRRIRRQFEQYVSKLVSHRKTYFGDSSPEAEFGSYMYNYEE